MPSRITFTRCRSAEAWQTACEASGRPVPLFLGYHWLDQAAELTGTRFLPWLVQDDGETIGVMPWMLRRRGPVTTVNWLPFPYVGPVVPAARLTDVLRSTGSLRRRYAVVVEQYGFPPDSCVSADELTGHGFTAHVDHTHVVDVSRPAEAILKGFDKDGRRKVRLAEKAGIRVETIDSLDPIGRVMTAIFTRHGLPWEYQLDRTAVASLEDRAHVNVRAAAAYQGDTFLGAVASLADERSAVGWVGGVLPEYQRLHANVLLVWDALQWAHSLGVRTFDLVGEPNPGIGAYKRQFGGQRLPYPVAERTLPAWRMARSSAEHVAAVARSRRAGRAGNPDS